MSCGVGHRRGSDLVFLWLGPLDWELPDTESAALKRKKKKFQLFLNVYSRSSLLFYLFSFPFLSFFFPTPQPQQLGIQAASATYTTAHSNARSLTHGTKPGIELMSSWILVRFVTTEPQQELLLTIYIFCILLIKFLLQNGE